MNAHSHSVSPLAISAAVTEAVEIALADVLARLAIEFPAAPEAATVIALPAPAEPVATEDHDPEEALGDPEPESNVVPVDFHAIRDEAEEIEPVAEEPAPEPDMWETVPADNILDYWNELAASGDEAAIASICEAHGFHYEPGHGWYRIAQAPAVTETENFAGAVDRDAFAAAVAMAGKAVERRNTIPVLSNVLIHAEGGKLAIEGTDLDCAIRVTVPYEGDDFAITAPAHTLATLAARKKGGRVTLAAEQTTVTRAGELVSQSIEAVSLSMGRSSLKLQTLPVADFPQLDCGEFPVSFDLSATDLCQAMKAVEFAISTEETRYYLNGIFLHTYSRLGKPVLRMVATDGHRLGYVDVKGVDVDMAEIRDNGVIVPRQTVARVMALLGKRPKVKKGEESPVAMVKVEVSDTRIRFTAGDIVITSKLVDGTYPDYNRVVPQGNDRIMRVDSAALADAIDLVTVITSERGRAVRLSMESNRLTLTVNNPDAGSATEEIDCEYDGEGFDIGFNSRYLLDIIAQVTPPGKRTEPTIMEFRFADPGSPTLIESGYGPSTVLMPMRV